MSRFWLAVVVVVSALGHQATAQTAKKAAAPKAPAPYTFEKDARPEIRQVSATIELALTHYKNAGDDSNLKQVALSALLINAQAQNLARALAPEAAQALVASQIQNSLQNNPQAAASAAAALNAARPDKQAASPTQSAGSTQLVEQAGATSLISLAVDSGALAQTTSGTTTTLSGNVYGMYSAFASPAGQLCRSTDKRPSCSWYGAIPRNTNVSATFSLAQASTLTTTQTQPATSSGTVPAGTAVTVPSNVGKLSSISAKYNMQNHFNPLSPSFRDRWSAAVNQYAPQMDTSSGQYLAAMQQFVFAILAQGNDQPAANAVLTKLDADARAIESAGSGDPSASNKQFADDLDAYYRTAIQAATAKGTAFYSSVSSLVEASNALQLVNREVVNQALGNMFTVEYDYVRTPQQPDMHNVTFIWGNSPSSSGSGSSGNTPTMFSANAGVSVYGGSIPAGATYGRFHYGQAAAEFDLPFSLNSSSKNATFTVAGYWQYQPSASVLNITQSDVAPGTTIPAPTQVLVGTAGNLYVAQAKVSLKGGKSGVNVPLGFKWSNKTELLSGSKYAGQFGISYDFSSIGSLFGGGSQ